MASSRLAKDVLERDDRQSSSKVKNFFKGHRTHPGTPSEADTSSVRFVNSQRTVCLGPEPQTQRGIEYLLLHVSQGKLGAVDAGLRCLMRATLAEKFRLLAGNSLPEEEEQDAR